jgi:hypothetical protein
MMQGDAPSRELWRASSKMREFSDLYVDEELGLHGVRHNFEEGRKLDSFRESVSARCAISTA